MSKRFVTTVLVALALVAGAVALAQVAGDSSAVQETLAELRQRAQRLTLLAEVPAEARAEASALLDRADALRSAADQLEIARLEAYIAALESGDSAAVAQEVASGQVSEASVDLSRQREALAADIQAFLETHPDVSASFRRSIDALSGSGTIVVRHGGRGAGAVLHFSPGGGQGLLFRGVPSNQGR